MFFKQVFTVRIIYKSGYAQDFECSSFEATKDFSSISWTSFRLPYPVVLNNNEIAAAWVVGQRKIFRIPKLSEIFKFLSK